MTTPFDLPDLGPEEFERFSLLVHERTGISLKEGKRTMLSNRLRRRLAALSLPSFQSYYEHLNSPAGDSEWSQFIAAVTTNESYFWRASQQLEMIRDELLPLLLERYPDRKLRFWSAACSTGEEPYNLAMEIVEGMKTSGYLDFEILASDISRRVIDLALKAEYSGRKVEKVPPLMLRRYFREDPKKPGVFEVRQDIKDRVKFRVENLFEAKFAPVDLIVCRNVMIYFSQETQEQLLHRFHDLLTPGGFLVVGHAESVHLGVSRFVTRRGKLGAAYEKPLPVG